VNGEPSCANEWLLKTVLRDTWEFDGYVTSDCELRRAQKPRPNSPPHSQTLNSALALLQTGDAEGDQAMRNKYPNASDAVAAILKAGTDVDVRLARAPPRPPAKKNQRAP
jgi:beta-glucosidase-like glycosyl hydrolase